MSPPSSELDSVIAALSDALGSNDAETGRALCESTAWEVRGSSIQRLFRQASRQSLRLVSNESPRIAGDRAAARVGVMIGQHLADYLWIVFQRNGDGPWLCLAVSESWPVVGLFLAGRLESFPNWRSLPSDPAVLAIGEVVASAVGTESETPPGVPEEAWAALTAPAESEGLVAAVGPVVALPEVNRAAFQIILCEPDDDFVVEDRWAILERPGPQAGWEIRECSFIGSLEALLDGLDVPETSWVTP